MNLTLYFRLILMSIFQVKAYCIYSEKEMISYDNTYFYCPRVFANDGFNVSLQINHNNYCESNNGYRRIGDTMIKVEFGFPSENEQLMFKYSEMWSSEEDKENFNVTDTVGNIPISVLEEVFLKHGGIDWNKTISTETFNKWIK